VKKEKEKWVKISITRILNFIELFLDLWLKVGILQLEMEQVVKVFMVLNLEMKIL